MEIRIYHNPRCRKSRAGLDYLVEKSGTVKIIDYIKNGLSVAEVMEIISKSGLKPAEMIRTQEEFYRKNLKGKAIPDSEWPEIIAENPKLMKRPVVITDDRAIIADPPQNLDELF